MPRITMKTVKTQRQRSAYDFVYDEISAAMDREVKPGLSVFFERITANWKNKPVVKGTKTLAQFVISMYVLPTGPSQKIWQFVSRGTKPHPIAPKRAKTLRFRWGGPGSYKPKTLPGARFGGPGIATGDIVHMKSVQHPGSDPRNFERYIADDYRKPFVETIRRATRRGLVAYKRAGRVVTV